MLALGAWGTVVRAIMVAIGTVAVTLGWTDQSTVDTIVGGLLQVAAVLWGIKEKFDVQTLLDNKDHKIVVQADKIDSLQQARTGY